MLPSNAADWDSSNPKPGRRRQGPGGGLIVTVVLLIGLIAIIAFAVTRLPTSTVPRAAATAVPASTAANPTAAAAGTPADDVTSKAIQDVIQKLDDAQTQAIASNDPQVMAATATSDFYAEQVAINQDLVNNGVSEVKLQTLEWGPITVDGNTATATVWETWSTTFQDGTTDQSRDRNVYTLINDPARGWIVQADDHPDQPTSTQSQ
jgi:hypothetical protein